ncbi:hypothetical protein NP493_421g00041 [Ridgeia piscesae]|uniref:Uncharacterized protein n=1 Tax=Ridgeia piscesae TaxID=27915 RepID=A0AAD9L0A1_RIDPI|nr:hypothetical protein NP493_421g00041 [Ridgeia piscesae]
MIKALHTGMMLMLVLEGKSRNRSVLQVLHHLPISNARRGFPRGEGWCLHTVQTER